LHLRRNVFWRKHDIHAWLQEILQLLDLWC
jgi:hypothetical protein